MEGQMIWDSTYFYSIAIHLILILRIHMSTETSRNNNTMSLCKMEIPSKVEEELRRRSQLAPKEKHNWEGNEQRGMEMEKGETSVQCSWCKLKMGLFHQNSTCFFWFQMAPGFLTLFTTLWLNQFDT